MKHQWSSAAKVNMTQSESFMTQSISSWLPSFHNLNPEGVAYGACDGWIWAEGGWQDS